MDSERRKLLVAALGAAGFVSGSRAFASADELASVIQSIVGDAEVTQGTLTLTIPRIAENGFSVPVSVSVESAMTEDSYVESIALLADANPIAQVITFNFTHYSGEAFAATRIRLATAQNVVAIARMSNGKVLINTQHVHVTVGGCGI